MRVVYAGAAPPLRGGIAQHGGNLVTALREVGAEVRIESWAAQYPRWLYPGETQVAGAAALPGTRRRMRWWRPDGWRRVGRLARTADVLIVPWVTTAQAPAVGTLLRAAAPSHRVIVAHNPLPHERRPFDVPLARWALAPAELALVHAQAVVSDLQAVRPGIESVIVPHPPNRSVTRQPVPPRPPLRVLFFGYVRPYKGLDVLIDAMERLRSLERDVRLTVAGEFWEPAADWERLVADRGLGPFVDLRPGYVPDEELDRLLSEHHVVAAPYRSATQSGIIPLAQAAGRIVVASDVGGIAESVRDGVDAVLAPPGDPDALATAICRADELVGLAATAPVTRWIDVAEALLDAVRMLPRHGPPPVNL